MFKITGIDINNILTIEPNWQFSDISGDKVIIRNIENIEYSKEFINYRLSILILNKYVQLKQDKISDCIIDGMIKCKVYLDEVNILEYLI